MQRGQAAEVTIAGNQDFTGASSILFEGTGLAAEILDAPKKDDAPKDMTKGRRRGGGAGAVKAKFSVTPDAALGPRELRVVTPQGVSSVGLVVVTADPVVPEADDKANDLPATAQEVALPALRHRVMLTPEAEVEGRGADELLAELIRSVEVPLR